MSARGKTTYLVACKADDASHVALGQLHPHSQGDDAEALDVETQPPGSRSPGGRDSIPSENDWADEATADSGTHLGVHRQEERVRKGTPARDEDVNSELTLEGIRPLGSVSVATTSSTSASRPSGLAHSTSHHTQPPSPHIVIPLQPGPAVQVTSGHFSMQGIRPEMEDRVTLLPHPEFNRVGNLPDNLTRSFFAVFDGHGGDVSAEYCRQHVHNNLVCNESFLGGNPSAGLRGALVKTESEFCAACRRINLMTSSGTTAITAYIEADTLYVGNIGDSRAVLCRSGRALDASTDHKPGRKDERARIEALGGRVGITEEDAFREHPRPCPCLWACVSAGRPLRVFPGGLSVSRTIGDISMKTTQLVSSEPEMWQSTLTPQDEFLVLCCDGVWDVMSSQQAIDCVRGCLYRTNNNAEEASRYLANDAFRRGSTDNISVVVVLFEFLAADGGPQAAKKK